MLNITEVYIVQKFVLLYSIKFTIEIIMKLTRDT
jgi:hypothetical protein